MPLLNKILKIVSVTVLALIASISLYLLSAFLLSRITVGPEENANDEVEIYILTNGVHTDIVVPTSNDAYNWKDEISHINELSNPASCKYLAIGWGDKGFYLNTPTWADLKFSTAFNAAFGLGTSAIHATYYSEMIESEVCTKILISAAQYRRLTAFISESLQKDENGRSIVIETSAVYGETDAFYEANGTFSLFRTCNSWANEGLKSSGQKACLWTAFQNGIFSKYN